MHGLEGNRKMFQDGKARGENKSTRSVLPAGGGLVNEYDAREIEKGIMKGNRKQWFVNISDTFVWN